MLKPGFREMLSNARAAGYAVGAFNIFNYISAKAVIQAAEDLKSVAIIQTSVSTVNQIGLIELIKMLKGLLELTRIPILIHLDHCTDADLAKQCIEQGWDAVMIDASKHTLEDNIKITAETKKYAEKFNVSVEGELGVIRGVEDNISSEIGVAANYDDSLKYLKGTGIDAFAPAVGTAHGIYKGAPNINYTLVKQLAETTACPIVIHGGTGLSEATFNKLISLGASKINVSTALKEAYFESLKSYIEKNNGDKNPLKLDSHVQAFLTEVVKDHMRLFKSINSADVLNN